jgi:hypothetical protein
MPFTDYEVTHLEKCDSDKGWHRIEDSVLQGLLRRLEMAERPLTYANGDSRFSAIQPMIDEWRRFTGKR